MNSFSEGALSMGEWPLLADCVEEVGELAILDRTMRQRTGA
jgi:hypothetical protein